MRDECPQQSNLPGKPSGLLLPPRTHTVRSPDRKVGEVHFTVIDFKRLFWIKTEWDRVKDEPLAQNAAARTKHWQCVRDENQQAAVYDYPRDRVAA